MNIHAPLNHKTEFPSWEFTGKRFTNKYGTWIRAKHKTWQLTYYYNFESNLFTKNKDSIAVIF